MKRALLVLLCSGLAGCSTLTPPRAAPSFPAQFTLSLPSSTPTAEAWASFGDTALSAWIAQVWAENSELSLGLARLDSAAIELRLVRAQQAVGINLEQALERKKNLKTRSWRERRHDEESIESVDKPI